MQINKVVLLGIAIVAIGLIALPQTLALFVGQHDFYDTTKQDIGVPCLKCHADIATELSQPSQVNSLHNNQGGGGGGPTNGCAACHILVAPIEKEGIQPGPGEEFHAAAAPACLDCHGGGLTPGPGLGATEILTGTEEVHKPFASAALNASTAMKSANEACVACHTHVAVNITWSKPTTLGLSASESASGGVKTWTVGNFAATGNQVINTAGTGAGGGSVVP